MALSDVDRALAAVLSTPGCDGRFGHREHVHLAWLAIEGFGPERGEEALCDILRVAISAGAWGVSYHDTLTRLWARLVAGSEHAPDDDFDSFWERNGPLRSIELTRIYYSPEVINSDEARRCWVAPDRRPL